MEESSEFINNGEVRVERVSVCEDEIEAEGVCVSRVMRGGEVHWMAEDAVVRREEVDGLGAEGRVGNQIVGDRGEVEEWNRRGEGRRDDGGGGHLVVHFGA